MDAELKRKWVEALRSGEYKQGTFYLKADNSYCCLGVLCDVANIPLHLSFGYKNRWDSAEPTDGTIEHNYGPIARFIGVKVEDLAPLWKRNDGYVADKIKQHTFSEIADYIEANL